MHLKLCYENKVTHCIRDNDTGCSKIEETLKNGDNSLYICLDEKEHGKRYLVHVNINTPARKIKKDKDFYKLKRAAKFCSRIEKLFQRST